MPREDSFWGVQTELIHSPADDGDFSAYQGLGGGGSRRSKRGSTAGGSTAEEWGRMVQGRQNGTPHALPDLVHLPLLQRAPRTPHCISGNPPQTRIAFHMFGPNRLPLLSKWLFGLSSQLVLLSSHHWGRGWMDGWHVPQECHCHPREPAKYSDLCVNCPCSDCIFRFFFLSFFHLFLFEVGGDDEAPGADKKNELGHVNDVHPGKISSSKNAHTSRM